MNGSMLLISNFPPPSPPELLTRLLFHLEGSQGFTKTKVIFLTLDGHLKLLSSWNVNLVNDISSERKKYPRPIPQNG